MDEGSVTVSKGNVSKAKQGKGNVTVSKGNDQSSMSYEAAAATTGPLLHGWNSLESEYFPFFGQVVDGLPKY